MAVAKKTTTTQRGKAEVKTTRKPRQPKQPANSGMFVTAAQLEQYLEAQRESFVAVIVEFQKSMVTELERNRLTASHDYSNLVIGMKNITEQLATLTKKPERETNEHGISVADLSKFGFHVPSFQGTPTAEQTKVKETLSLVDIMQQLRWRMAGNNFYNFMFNVDYARKKVYLVDRLSGPGRWCPGHVTNNALINIAEHLEHVYGPDETRKFMENASVYIRRSTLMMEEIQDTPVTNFSQLIYGN